jgi:anti-anti-sigma regulatory factor
MRLDGPGVVHLVLHGELDLATADQLTAQVTAALPAPPAPSGGLPRRLVPDVAGWPAPPGGPPCRLVPDVAASPAPPGGPQRRLVLDVAALTFCDSSGVEGLLNARAEAQSRGVAFEVAGARGIVRRSMAATGVLALLAGS